MTTETKVRNGELSTWEPFEDLSRTRARLMHLFGDVWPDWLRTTGGFVPDADVVEEDTKFTVEVELPGIDKGDLSIDVEGRRLSVRGERKMKEREGVLRRSTRTTGEFAYEIMLPTDIDADQVSATMADGVLHITLPKSRELHGRHVEIA
jgi:HSP20 family protein